MLFVATGDVLDSDSDPFIGSVPPFPVGSSVEKTEHMPRRKSNKTFQLMHVD